MNLGPTIIMASALVAGSPASAQTHPSMGPVVHGQLYFQTGAVSPREQQIDPVEYLAPRVPHGSYVLVTGYADTAGPPDENLRLSRQRAFGIADRLVRLGVAPSSITVVACGETQLAKATGDGVDEPLNRRVYFDWQSGPYSSANGCTLSAYVSDSPATP